MNSGKEFSKLWSSGTNRAVIRLSFGATVDSASTSR
jgi:hypothetical protein